MANAMSGFSRPSLGALTPSFVTDQRRRLSTCFADLVYPRRCASCGERGAWVCSWCRPLVARFADQAVCDGCGLPVIVVCRCEEVPLHIGRMRSVGPFDGWLRDEILKFKYEDEWARVDDLSPFVAAAVATFPALPTALVPVPLHPRRLRERGYNQSALIAAAVGSQLGVPMVEALVRTRATAQQARLDAAARAENVAGAFACPGDIDLSGQTIVLVDDVLTTGATLGACALAIQPANPAAIWAVTVARQG